MILHVWRRYAPFSLCVALLATPLSAEPLSLPQALALAERHSPLLQGAQAQRAGAHAALESALAYPNPEAEITSGRYRPRHGGGESGRGDTLGLSQPVELPSLRTSRAALAQAGITVGEAALEQARLDLRTHVKQAYYEAQRREEEARLADENHALLLLIRNRVKLRVEVGEAPRYELVKAEAEALNAGSQARSAQLRISQAKAALRALLGAPLPDDFELSALPPAPQEAPSLETLRAEMQARLPALRAGQAAAQRAQARVAMERSLRLPQPVLKWSAERDPETSLWRLGVALPLPLWNRREGPIGEAVAGLHQAEAGMRHLELTLLNELDQAHGRYQIARRQVAVYEGGLLAEAENALKVAEAAYRFGERSILDYLDAQRTLRMVRMDYLEARYELLAALTEIERLRATPFDGELS